MGKMSVTANGNVLVVDGESYLCEDSMQAESLCEAISGGGFHIEDHSHEMQTTAVEQDFEMAKKRYRDHFAASPQEEAECLACLTDILFADTDEERDQAVEFYTNGSYPALATMAYRAIEGLRKAGDKVRAAEVVHGLAEHMPDVFGVMQRIYAA